MVIQWRRPSAGARRRLVGYCACAVSIVALLGARPASAQMLGLTMSQLAGPFAGRMGPNRLEMSPLYGSQAGTLPHMLQGTAAPMLSNDGSVFFSSGLHMAASAEGEKSGAP